MRAVIQRVKKASVTVIDEAKAMETEVGRIDNGLLVYLGLGREDSPEDEDYIVEKICHLRIFPDEQGRFDRSIIDVGGAILLISQFTLYGDARKGRRPSFSNASPPAVAIEAYERVQQKLRAKGLTVETGVFQAHMEISSVNDGPVTILLDSKKVF